MALDFREIDTPYLVGRAYLLPFRPKVWSRSAAKKTEWAIHWLKKNREAVRKHTVIRQILKDGVSSGMEIATYDRKKDAAWKDLNED